MLKDELAFIFPGQGSQHVGMMRELTTLYPIAKKTFEQASDVLGYDVLALTLSDPEEKLNQTEYTQPALLTASVAVYRVWETLSPLRPQMMAGHSLGEYSALVCADSLDFQDAVKLVRKRGQLMQSAVAEGIGAMAAIIGLENADVASVCEAAAEGEIVSPANMNAIGQVVISGHRAAVERAIILAKERGAKIAKLIPVSVPSHCALMKPASELFKICLAETTIRAPQCAVIQNVDVKAHNSPDAIRDALTAQLFEPVRWVETVQFFAQNGIKHLLELGPGKVLAGLNKRIDNTIETLPIYDEATLQHAIMLEMKQNEFAR